MTSQRFARRFCCVGTATLFWLLGLHTSAVADTPTTPYWLHSTTNVVSVSQPIEQTMLEPTDSVADVTGPVTPPPPPPTAAMDPLESVPDPAAHYDQESIEAILLRLEQLERSVAAAGGPDALPADGPAPDTCGGGIEPASDCSQCAGYDKGFYIRTTDGNFMLKINAMIQARYFANWRNLDPGDGDETEAGFVLARSPLIFSGNVISPQLTYWMILQSSGVDGRTFMEECRINYEFDNGLFVEIGRFRDPSFMRELDISYARQMGVDRSYQYAIFSTGIQEGICFSKQNDDYRVLTFITDGRTSGNPGVNKDFYQDACDFAVSSGIDVKFMGDWTQYGDFASWSDEPAAAFLGADIHYEGPETGDDVVANNMNEYFAWTVDATYERCGFMAFASLVQRHSLAEAQDITQSGVEFMTAYQIIPDKIEPFFIYQYVDFDGYTNVGSKALPVADSSVNIVNAGVNWYFKRHACKATFEVSHAFDPIPIAVPYTGFLEDVSGNSGQTVFRTQLQLLF
ncbi:hypothetical protein NG895_07420 [Aeoliella sp. ICT_H6.2]|uniref:Phosphate-selective porin O and P n=1 Tax=Aeoliella straminimaris TaxID=2954799 RepID=A0A9X2F8R7_9BACT|nr:hypothetical protein [Aeoliella straminimaris]MCO6043733.1 hypothetical protein [Aeoliella straminimaris]